jgi:(p)ppGpp synthase/HD superfamily hydrolase
MMSPRFDEAALYALEKHRAQRRKGSGVPYATHLFAVAAMVGERGGDEEQMMAALLHDVIEDQGVSGDELEVRFGPRVRRIVEGCTDAFVSPKPPWRERKERYLALLPDKPAEVLLVSACDKLHNALSIARDAADPEVGPRVWERFSAGREASLWYYRALVDAFRLGLSHSVVDELARAVRALEEPTPRGAP